MRAECQGTQLRPYRVAVTLDEEGAGFIRRWAISARDVRRILECDRDQAYRRPRNWVDKGLLELKGEGRGAPYVIGMRLRENARL